MCLQLVVVWHSILRRHSPVTAFTYAERPPPPSFFFFHFSFFFISLKISRSGREEECVLASCFCSSAIPFGVRGGACFSSVASEQSISENRFFYFRYSVRQGLCSQSSPCTLPHRLPTKVSSPACHRSTDLLSELGAALRLNCCGWFIPRDVGRYSNNAKDSFITTFGRGPSLGVCFFQRRNGIAASSQAVCWRINGGNFYIF